MNDKPVAQGFGPGSNDPGQSRFPSRENKMDMTIVKLLSEQMQAIAGQVVAKQEEMEGLSIQENTKYNGRKQKYDLTDEEAKSALIDSNQDIAQRLLEG